MAAPAPLPPDEAAFYEAWLGKLWPVYRDAFAPGGAPVDFEWRAALYPLWLVVPGLFRQLAVAAALVLAAAAMGASELGSFKADLTFYLAGVALLFWPGAFLFLSYLWISGELSGSVTVWPVAMVVAAAALGRFTPRWIVAEGRRRWRAHAARAASGAAPAPPKSLTAWRPLYAVLLAVAAFLVIRPWFTGHDDAHQRAYAAALKSDLRNLVTAQEAFFVDSLRYARDLAALRFEASHSVTVEIVAAGDSGWAATARHYDSPQTCGIFVGTAAPPVEGATEGEPHCVTPDD